MGLLTPGLLQWAARQIAAHFLMTLIDAGWILPLCLATAAIAWLLAALLVRHAAALGLIDVPSARSAHHDARPRGGGLAIVLASAMAFLVAGALMAWSWHLWLLLTLPLPVAAAGLLDDRYGLPPRWRLTVQLLMALSLTALLMPLPAIPVGPWWLTMDRVGWLLVPLAAVWLVNLYNFMDGIDSLAVQQFVFVCLALLLLLADRAPTISLLCALLLAAALGFALWNLPPARIFMGDVGSNYLGFVLAMLALMTLEQELISLWSWLLLMGVFIADTSATLFVRWRGGERLTQAHDRHAYQHLSRRWRSHGRVVLAVMLINGLWLLPLAWLASAYPEYGVLLAISGIVPLLVIATRLGAGRFAPMPSP